MKALCVTASRQLEVRQVPTPTDIPDGHLLIRVEAAAINHGDKAFLAMPAATAGFNTSRYDIWGASAAGTVIAAGREVPGAYTGSRVAVYRSLTPSEHTVGLWSEQAVVPASSCLVLPTPLTAEDYCGSLVNVITAHAFLETMTAEGHQGVVATVGASATGLALAALASARNIPVIHLVRGARSAQSLRDLSLEHVLASNDPGFDEAFEGLARDLGTTAVFDGAGGDAITRIAPRLPRNSTVWLYGFLAGITPIAIPSGLFMAKNLTLKPFSNFNSATVREPAKLRAALDYLETQITDPLFRTRLGARFRPEQIDEALAYEAQPGAKALLEFVRTTSAASG